MSKEAFIELSDVDVLRENGSAVLLRAVNWRIAPGDFWVLSGGRSSGKTSLLATAAGLNRLGGGTLRIFGRNLAEATEEEQVEWRRRIGFVFENGGRLLHHLTVAGNLALPLEYHLELEEQVVRKKVEEMLERAELSAYAHATPSRLSLRAQQRVGLMRALAVPTQVLFLDNVLNGLSAREERWWLDALRELRSHYATPDGKPLTIAASSDDFRGWLDLANRFALIHGDQLRVLGGREELLANKEAAVLELV
jgi:ABC-type transporter Mla maintaining outer membrane lipid asymmetry ATPase subunit MlaF